MQSKLLAPPVDRSELISCWAQGEISAVKQEFRGHLSSLDHKRRSIGMNASSTAEAGANTDRRSEMKEDGNQKRKRVKREDEEDAIVVLESPEPAKSGTDHNNNDCSAADDPVHSNEMPLSEEMRLLGENVRKVEPIGSAEASGIGSLKITHTINGLSMVESISEERGAHISTNIPFAEPVFVGEYIRSFSLLMFTDRNLLHSQFPGRKRHPHPSRSFSKSRFSVYCIPGCPISVRLF